MVYADAVATSNFVTCSDLKKMFGDMAYIYHKGERTTLVINHSMFIKTELPLSIMKNTDWVKAELHVKDIKSAQLGLEFKDMNKLLVNSVVNGILNGRKDFTSVDIPMGVTFIGRNAFQGCRNLTSVIIPKSVKFIGMSAFKDCKSLTSVTISDSVIRIGDWAFQGCTNLTSVTIPESVTYIGRHAFKDCNYCILYAIDTTKLLGDVGCRVVWLTRD